MIDDFSLSVKTMFDSKTHFVGHTQGDVLPNIVPIICIIYFTMPKCRIYDQTDYFADKMSVFGQSRPFFAELFNT